MRTQSPSRLPASGSAPAPVGPVAPRETEVSRRHPGGNGALSPAVGDERGFTDKRPGWQGALLLAMAILSAAVGSATALDVVRRSGDMRQGYPLVRGTWYIYRGHVKWQPERGPAKVEPVTWKSEITETLTRGHLLAAKITGHPIDLINWRPRAVRLQHVMLRVSGRRFFLVSGAAAEKLWQRLRDPNDGLVGLVSGSDLVLDLPLVFGEPFGEIDQLTRTDHNYVWQVDLGEPHPDVPIKGVMPARWRPVWRLRYQTNPDHQIVDFLPDVGIVRYRYAHHGSPAEVDVSLTEFWRGRP